MASGSQSPILLYVAVLALPFLAWRGYQVRRPMWTRRNWFRFAGFLILNVGLVAGALLMALGVDYGVYSHLTRAQGHIYFSILMVSTLVIGGATGLFIRWFISGRRGPAWLEGPIDLSTVEAALPPKRPGVVFMIWGGLMFVVQFARQLSVTTVPMTDQYRAISLLLPVAMFVYGLHLFRASSKP